MRGRFKFFATSLLTVLMGSGCRSGHFESKNISKTSSGPTTDMPQTPVLIEKLLSTPMSLTAVKQVERSPQTTDLSFEHMVIFSSQNTQRLSERKISYRISFSDPTMLDVEGSGITNEHGELSILFSASFHPYENESNLEVRIRAKMGENENATATDWSLLINFDRNITLSYSREKREPSKALNVAPQRLMLRDFRLEETPSAETSAFDENFRQSFKSEFHLKSSVELSRKRLGKSEAEWKKLARVKVRGKIFALRETSNGLKEVLSEQAFEVMSNISGEIDLELHPRVLGFPISSLPTRWMIALELPEFPKTEKAFFSFDARASVLASIPKAQAVAALGGKVYDLGTPSPFNIPKGEKVSELSVKDFYPKASEFKDIPDDFEGRLSRAVVAKNSEAWRNLFESFDSKVRFLFGDKGEVKQLDFIQSIRSTSILDRKVFGIFLRTGGAIEVRAQIIQYSLLLKGVSKRCYVFSGIQDFYYCTPKPMDFEISHQRSIIFPIAGESGFEPLNIHGAIDGSLSLPELKTKSLQEKRSVSQEKVYPVE